MPTELELIALNTEFDLYLPFSKRLVLNLPNSKDRTRAALWLQKLRSIKDNNFKKLRNEHLKLFLFALHRRSLVGIFEHPPPKDELESFHDGLTLMEMTRELIEITEKREQQGGNVELEEGECPLPKVMTGVSHDLKEYTAMQTIPKFGAHVFYAVSNEPLQFWKKSANGVYPGMGEVPNQLRWEQVFAKLSDHVLEKQAEIDRRMELIKAIEAGDATADDLEPDIDFKKKINVPICPPYTFKWKKDSVLLTHQNYDFSEITDADDVEIQGTRQLEEDEEAFHFMDDSTPGRRKIVIRDPYFAGLPEDILERKHHGVLEEIPEWEEVVESNDCEDDLKNLWPPEQGTEPCPCDQEKCPCGNSSSVNTSPTNENPPTDTVTQKNQAALENRPNFSLQQFGENSNINNEALVKLTQETSMRFAERRLSKKGNSYLDRGYTLDDNYKQLTKVQENNPPGVQFDPKMQPQHTNYYPAQIQDGQHFSEQQSVNYFDQTNRCDCVHSSPKPQSNCDCPQVQGNSACGSSDHSNSSNQEKPSCHIECVPVEQQDDLGNQNDRYCGHS